MMIFIGIIFLRQLHKNPRLYSILNSADHLPLKLNSESTEKDQVANIFKFTYDSACQSKVMADFHNLQGNMEHPNLQDNSFTSQ